MHGSNLRWSAAAEEAARIAESWNKAGEPGGAIAVFDADRIRSEACGGLADLATAAKFSADTVSRYASITKHVFAAMLVAHPDEIGVDDKLGAHLPFLTGATRGVSVGRALDMTGGLPDLRETLSHLGVEGATVSAGPALIDFVARNGAANFTAGTEISYSNTGYRLSEHALRLKGVDFETHLRTRINAKLGIGFHAPEHWFDPVAKLAPGYWKSGDAWRLSTSGMQLSASGCLTGSVRDLSVWLQALMTDRGPAQGALAKLSALRHLADGRATDYGLGLARTTLGSRTLFGHGGSHAGYKAYFLFDPDAQAGVALVSNREDTISFDGALRVMAIVRASLLTGMRTAPRPRSSGLCSPREMAVIFCSPTVLQAIWTEGSIFTCGGAVTTAGGCTGAGAEATQPMRYQEPRSHPIAEHVRGSFW